MKKLAILYTSVICVFCMHQGSLADEKTDKKDPFDPVEYFQAYVDDSHEAYLVCVSKSDIKVREDLHKDLNWGEIRGDSTIVQVIKGERSVGENFSFVRISDLEIAILAKLEKNEKRYSPGKLFYVFTCLEKGIVRFDIGDPCSMWSYDPKYADVLNKKSTNPNLPKHLTSAKQLIEEVFPDGLNEAEYLTTLKIFHPHLWDHNLSRVMATCYKSSEVMLSKDISKIVQMKINEFPQFDTILLKFKKAGLDKWIEED